MKGMPHDSQSRAPLTLPITDGFNALEPYVDYDVFLYLLRAVCELIQHAGRRQFSQRRLYARLKQFETDSQLPGLLTGIPFHELLRQLEDAQYRYPLSRYELHFSKFY